MSEQSSSVQLTLNEITLKPELCYFGSVQAKGKTKNFGILKDDRRRHMYILGKTGMGKSTLLENMILQDIYNGSGVCFLDPHGDSAEYILSRVPAHRQKDVIYFNPADTDNPIGFNMLEAKRGEEPFLIASGMMAVFNRIWAGMWSSRMEYILNNCLLALLETPGNTLLGVMRMLTDKDFQAHIVSGVKDPMVKNFWLKEFASFNEKYKQEAISPVLNKIGQFFSTDLIRNILGQEKSTIDFRDIMDNQKILIVNLSKGRLGEDNSNLLGSLLVTKLQLAAMSRVDIPESERKDFYVYVDEFQNFTTDSFATILSEARKYRLSLILAHQYIAQLTESGNEKIKNAILGNVGSIISFRIGSEDAQIMAREFEPAFTSPQLISLHKAQIVLKMSIEGRASTPFLASTLPPLFEDLSYSMEQTIQFSRDHYTVSKDSITNTINNWLETTYAPEDAKKKKKPSAFNQLVKPTKPNIAVNEPIETQTVTQSQNPTPALIANTMASSSIKDQLVKLGLVNTTENGKTEIKLPTKTTAQNLQLNPVHVSKLQSLKSTPVAMPEPKQPESTSSKKGFDDDFLFELPG